MGSPELQTCQGYTVSVHRGETNSEQPHSGASRPVPTARWRGTPDRRPLGPLRIRRDRGQEGAGVHTRRHSPAQLFSHLIVVLDIFLPERGHGGLPAGGLSGRGSWGDTGRSRSSGNPFSQRPWREARRLSHGLLAEMAPLVNAPFPVVIESPPTCGHGRAHLSCQPWGGQGWRVRSSKAASSTWERWEPGWAT